MSCVQNSSVFPCLPAEPPRLLREVSLSTARWLRVPVKALRMATGRHGERSSKMATWLLATSLETVSQDLNFGFYGQVFVCDSLCRLSERASFSYTAPQGSSWLIRSLSRRPCLWYFIATETFLSGIPPPPPRNPTLFFLNFILSVPACLPHALHLWDSPILMKFTDPKTSPRLNTESSFFEGRYLDWTKHYLLSSSLRGARTGHLTSSTVAKLDGAYFSAISWELSRIRKGQ